MALEFVDYNGNDITSLITQPNDNLLINSDFRNGIINQRGKTQYIHGNGSRTYGIDCWYVNGKIPVWQSMMDFYLLIYTTMAILGVC